jgi:hypothetical protein
VREKGNGCQAVRCGKEATDVKLSGAEKNQRMSGCQVREKSNGCQAVRCGKEATDVKLSGAGKKQRMSGCQVRDRSNGCRAISAGKKRRLSGCQVRKGSSGFHALRCGKGATYVRLRYGKMQRASDFQVQGISPFLTFGAHLGPHLRIANTYTFGSVELFRTHHEL